VARTRFARVTSLELKMKSLWIKIRMGRADILDAEVEDEATEAWLLEKFEHLTSLMEGRGRVNVEGVAPLRIDVGLDFTVQGDSVADVMERFKSDFQALAPQVQSVEVGATKRYKLCFPTVGGEQFPVFVRIDPESGRPVSTED
jgi:hypothetical protein